MALRQIRLEHDELLRKKSKPVKEINGRIHELLDDMAETMYEKNGVGLAAPQVGVLRRVVVIDVGDGIIELINPEMIETNDTQQNDEGCLSVPGRRGLVERPLSVKVKALNRNGDEIIVEGEGFLAIALCHELDHLDGVLYIDKVIGELSDIDENEESEEDFEEEEEE